MQREKHYQSYLPPELKSNSFWAKSHVKRPTSFGCEARQLEIRSDDPYFLENQIDSWENIDKFRVNHGRLQISTGWGSLTRVPPPSSKYNPNHERLSHRENGPFITIAHKPEDKEYFENLERAQTFRFQKSSTNSSIPKKRIREKGAKLVTEGLKNVNVDDMRKALLPGPGTYETNSELGVKFERTPQPFLPRRDPVAKSRPRLNFESLELVNKDNLLFNGSYYPDEDRTQKSIKTFTMGCKRPLLGEREYPQPGLGDYEDHYFRVGNSTMTSSNSNLHPRGSTEIIIRKGEGRPSVNFPRRSLVSKH